MLTQDHDSGISIDSVSTADLDVTSRKVVMDITKQLYKNLDLQRISLPTFFLEPRSLLERITDSLSHPDLLLSASIEQDPLERFLGVVKYFLSGWHSSPKGVKKPYNPVLGEVFKCKYEYNHNNKSSEAFFIAEQVSHHPPISAFYYGSPENGIYIKGDVRPKTRFLGTCVSNTMEGENRIIFTNFDHEEYIVVMPSVYIYGVLYGNMYLDLGDKCSVTCKATGYSCDFKFSSKSMFTGGEYNSVSGKVKNTSGEVLYEIEGQWSHRMYIIKDSVKELFFDATSASIHPKIVAPLEKQSPIESRRLWSKVSEAIKSKNLDIATEEKTVIENKQRMDVKKRKAEQKEHITKYFTLNEKNKYKFMGIKRNDYTDTEKAKSKLIETIFPATTDYLATKEG